MNENEKLGFWYSWPAIILMLCIFWPVGVYLIIKRTSKDRKTEMGAGKLIGYLGIASYVMAGCGVIACMSDGFGSDDVGLIIFFGAAGYVLRKVSNKMKKNSEKVKQYLSIIINGNVRQLDTIASTTGEAYDIVHKDIKNMIEKGYLKNAYIDEGLREVVLPNSVSSSQNDVNTTQVNNVSKQAKIVTCPCCGANNTISGDIGECEYCGSPLK